MNLCIESSIVQINVNNREDLKIYLKSEEVKEVLDKKRTIFCIYYVEGMDPLEANDMINVGKSKIKTKNLYILPQGKLGPSVDHFKNRGGRRFFSVSPKNYLHDFKEESIITILKFNSSNHLKSARLLNLLT